MTNNCTESSIVKYNYVENQMAFKNVATIELRLTAIYELLNPIVISTEPATEQFSSYFSAYMNTIIGKNMDIVFEMYFNWRKAGMFTW